MRDKRLSLCDIAKGIGTRHPSMCPDPATERQMHPEIRAGEGRQSKQRHHSADETEPRRGSLPAREAFSLHALPTSLRVSFHPSSHRTTPFRQRQTLSVMDIRRECKTQAEPCQHLAERHQRRRPCLNDVARLETQHRAPPRRSPGRGARGCGACCRRFGLEHSRLCRYVSR
jgi:hypothetical protein